MIDFKHTLYSFDAVNFALPGASSSNCLEGQVTVAAWMTVFKSTNHLGRMEET